MTTGSNYKDGFLSMAEEYRGILSREGMAFLDRIANEKSVRGVLLTVYDILRDAGKLIPIEQLPTEQKQELWEEAVKRCINHSQEARVECCKAFHALGVWCIIQEEKLTR